MLKNVYFCQFLHLSHVYCKEIFIFIIMNIRMQIVVLNIKVIEGNGTPFQYFCLENPMD